jgi:hypothetical protein
MSGALVPVASPEALEPLAAGLAFADLVRLLGGLARAAPGRVDCCSRSTVASRRGIWRELGARAIAVATGAADIACGAYCYPISLELDT